jgi:hypothetical protein
VELEKLAQGWRGGGPVQMTPRWLIAVRLIDKGDALFLNSDQGGDLDLAG